MTMNPAMKRRGKALSPAAVYTDAGPLVASTFSSSGWALLALAWPFYSDLYTRLTAALALDDLGRRWAWFVDPVLAADAGMRNSAYVQPSRSYLRLVTPFLRMNISYRRIQQHDHDRHGRALSAAEPARPAARHPRAALRADRRGHRPERASPCPGLTLRLFLSPFFFKDQTPHLVILVEDWMRFSTELESMRLGTSAPTPTAAGAVLHPVEPARR